jgi:hypothetical protein
MGSESEGVVEPSCMLNQRKRLRRWSQTDTG